MCALVTGVQTCALPIFRLVVLPAMVRLADRLRPRLRRVQFHRGALDPPQLRALSRLPDVSGAAPLAAPPHPAAGLGARGGRRLLQRDVRSEEHTSELQSLMRISYAVFCLKKNKSPNTNKKWENYVDDTNSQQPI